MNGDGMTVANGGETGAEIGETAMAGTMAIVGIGIGAAAIAVIAMAGGIPSPHSAQER